MRIKDYKELVDKHKPTEHRIKNGVIAFISGGIIGIIEQGLIDIYSYFLKIPASDAAIFGTVTLIFFACLFTALGFFDKWVTFCRCGLIIPITGFAHSIMSAGMEYKTEGAIFGLGSNIFKLSGSVILYGVVSAWIFGMIRFMLMGG